MRRSTSSPRAPKKSPASRRNGSSAKAIPPRKSQADRRRRRHRHPGSGRRHRQRGPGPAGDQPGQDRRQVPDPGRRRAGPSERRGHRRQFVNLPRPILRPVDLAPRKCHLLQRIVACHLRALNPPWSRPMFIQTEATPNPATLKFLPGRAVLETARSTCPNQEAREIAAGRAAVRHRECQRRVLRLRLHHRDQGRRRMAAAEAGDPRRHHGAFHVGAPLLADDARRPTAGAENSSTPRTPRPSRPSRN